MLRSHQIKSLKDNEGITSDGKVFTTSLEQRMNAGKTAKHLIPLTSEENAKNNGRQRAEKRAKRDKNKILRKLGMYGAQNRKRGVSLR